MVVEKQKMSFQYCKCNCTAKFEKNWLQNYLTLNSFKLTSTLAFKIPSLYLVSVRINKNAVDLDSSLYLTQTHCKALQKKKNN